MNLRTSFCMDAKLSFKRHLRLLFLRFCISTNVTKCISKSCSCMGPRGLCDGRYSIWPLFEFLSAPVSKNRLSASICVPQFVTIVPSVSSLKNLCTCHRLEARRIPVVSVLHPWELRASLEFELNFELESQLVFSWRSGTFSVTETAL